MNKQGIQNQGNLCFLNSIMNCLSSIIPSQLEDNMDQFHQYLNQTIEYLNNEDSLKNIYLFICELRKRNPQLFDQSFDYQKPQDASEVLQWILKEAKIDNISFIDIFQEEEICQIEQIQKVILLYFNWENPFIYYIIDNIDINVQLKAILHDCQLQFFKMNKQNYQIDEIEQLDNDWNTYNYYVEPIPQQYINKIKVQLQYIENDIIIDIHPKRTLYLDSQINVISLKTIIQKKLNTLIDFDIIWDGQTLQDNIEDVSILENIECLFRTKDLDEFLYCKYLSKDKSAYNFREILQIETPQQLINQYQAKSLILTLQRFMYHNGRLIKNTDPYKIRDKIINQGKIYQLQAICCHQGNDIQGHYVSYKRKGDMWEMMDDEQVITMKPIGYKAFKDAYILFYDLIQQ